MFKDIGKIVSHLELAGIAYTFNGRRLETDAAVLYCDDAGVIIDAKLKDAKPVTGLLAVDARLRK